MILRQVRLVGVDKRVGPIRAFGVVSSVEVERMLSIDVAVESRL
jgi:hypothetical protein